MNESEKQARILEGMLAMVRCYRATLAHGLATQDEIAALLDHATDSLDCARSKADIAAMLDRERKGCG